MKTSQPSELGNVLNAAALGIASTILLGLAFAIGYQTEKQAFR